MIGDFINMLSGLVFDFLGGMLGILPEAPNVTGDITQLGQLDVVLTVVGYANYFLPFNAASLIIGAWTAGMLTYLGIKMTMKYAGELAL